MKPIRNSKNIAINNRIQELLDTGYFEEVDAKTIGDTTGKIRVVRYTGPGAMKFVLEDEDKQEP